MRRLLKRLLYRVAPGPILGAFQSKRVGQFNELSDGEIEVFHRINNLVCTIIDVGARTDTFYSSNPLSVYLPRKVYMFEPNPTFANVLENKVRSLNGTNYVIPCAIGREETEMYYFYDTQSFVEKSSVGTVSKSRSLRPIKVQTIDSFSIKDCDFLKTDIEEMDFYALLGARNTLPGVHFLQFELGLGMPYQNRTVRNSDYWELLEPRFHLFILKDRNPIWGAFPDLPLLLELNPTSKLIIEILQSTGVGFNVFGINRSKGIPDTLRDHISSVST